MHNQEILTKLLQIGKHERLSWFPVDATSRRDRRSFVASLRMNSELISSIRSLAPEDRLFVIKAIALIEDSVGGFGSVTALSEILPLGALSEDERRILDWVLKNTRSYRYYTHDAKSIEEYETIRNSIQVRKEERMRIEKARQEVARQHKVEVATHNLYKAICRKDVKAVVALLSKGANPEGLTPSGEAYYQLAKRNGFMGIANVLRSQ